MNGLKKLWEAVDNAQKSWTAVVLVLGPLLMRVGVRSESMRWALVTALFLGCALGYWFTVAKWSGRGRDACLRRRSWYFWLCLISSLVIVAMLLTLEPDTARSWHLEKVRDVLISSNFLPNAIGFLGVFFGTYFLVGAIVLSSPRLW